MKAAFLILVAMVCLAGCGGSGGGQPDPYTVTVNFDWEGAESQSVRLRFESVTSQILAEKVVNRTAAMTSNTWTLPAYSPSFILEGYSQANAGGNLIGSTTVQTTDEPMTITLEPNL